MPRVSGPQTLVPKEGFPMTMQCTRCRTMLPPGSRACPGCGLEFAIPVPDDPASPAVPPYGQSPYGQPPQASYGQAPPYGQPPAYGQPPSPVLMAASRLAYGAAAPRADIRGLLWGGGLLAVAAVGSILYFARPHPRPSAPTPAPTPRPWRRPRPHRNRRRRPVAPAVSSGDAAEAAKHTTAGKKLGPR